MSPHSCHAIACTKRVEPRMLFCAKHWRMTPRDTQRLVWTAYRDGQEVDKRPSALYLLVQSMAVAEVAVLDGRFTPSQQEAHVKATAERVWNLLTPEDAKVIAAYRPESRAR